MKRSQERSKRPLWKKVLILTLRIAVGLFLFSVLLTVAYRWINPPITYLQLREKWSCPEGCTYHQQWVDHDQISPYMKLAVVASEDNNFMRHNGFDWGAIEKARAYNAAHPKGKLRGASTISQQTAKNVFLWPSRSWVRKGFEVYFTFLIELLWPKERILEVYLNVIETGPCKFGVEAAARDYFGVSASALSREQAALIAGCLPKPRTMNPGRPSAYLRKRQGQIARLMRLIGDDYFQSYEQNNTEQKNKKEKQLEQELQKLNPDELPEQSTDDEDDPTPSNTEDKKDIRESEEPVAIPDSSSAP